MTLDELEESLPNGLHDAEILHLVLDYVAHTARFELNVWVGDMDCPAGPERERYRRAALELTGLVFCAIEPPDFRPDYLPRSLASRAPVTTSGLSAVASPSPLPDGAFEARLFVAEWNSFIQVAATNAALVWMD